MKTELNTSERLPQEWHDWIATNIVRGVQPETIFQTLKDNNFSDAQIKAALSDNSKVAANDSKQPIRRLPNNWKEWVATNLLEGTSKNSIAKVLVKQGFSHAEILLEIETAAKSPYLQAGVKATKLLKKREWLLNTCDDLAKLDPGYNQQIEVIDTPAFETFIKDYYSKHKPVVLKKASIIGQH